MWPSVGGSVAVNGSPHSAQRVAFAYARGGGLVGGPSRVGRARVRRQRPPVASLRRSRRRDRCEAAGSFESSFWRHEDRRDTGDGAFRKPPTRGGRIGKFLKLLSRGVPLSLSKSLPRIQRLADRVSVCASLWMHPLAVRAAANSSGLSGSPLLVSHQVRSPRVGRRLACPRGVVEFAGVGKPVLQRVLVLWRGRRSRSPARRWGTASRIFCDSRQP